MIRTLAGLLLLLAVFFTGLVLGIKQDDKISDPLPREINYPSEEIVDQEVFSANNLVENTDPLEAEVPIHTTQKTASFLEKGVNGFYNIVINVMYQISSLFI